METSELTLTPFVRKPFEVEAVQITEENIASLAKYIGDLEHQEGDTPYIKVDRRLVPNVFRVTPGFWMTRMGDNTRCYSDKIFTEQFVQKNATIAQMAEAINAPVDA